MSLARDLSSPLALDTAFGGGLAQAMREIGMAYMNRKMNEADREGRQRERDQSLSEGLRNQAAGMGIFTSDNYSPEAIRGLIADQSSKDINYKRRVQSDKDAADLAQVERENEAAPLKKQLLEAQIAKESNEASWNSPFMRTLRSGGSFVRDLAMEAAKNAGRDPKVIQNPITGAAEQVVSGADGVERRPIPLAGQATSAAPATAQTTQTGGHVVGANALKLAASDPSAYPSEAWKAAGLDAGGFQKWHELASYNAKEFATQMAALRASNPARYQIVADNIRAIRQANP